MWDFIMIDSQIAYFVACRKKQQSKHIPVYQLIVQKTRLLLYCSKLFFNRKSPEHKIDSQYKTDKCRYMIPLESFPLKHKKGKNREDRKGYDLLNDFKLNQ